MDEKEILALLTAVRAGSFSKAAEKLGYSQPGLTQMMNRMESELGCKLLCRSYSGVHLTSEGEKLLPYFEKVSRSMDELRNEIQRIRTRDIHAIRIGAYPSVAKSLLPALLKSFQDRYPDSTLELRIGGYDIQGWLAANAVDLAFVDENLGSKWNWQPLFTDPYCAAVSVKCPLSGKSSVSIQDLAQYPFILSQINELKPLTRLSGIREKIHISAEDDASLLSLVEQGLGVTVLPASSLKGHPEGISVLTLNPPLSRTIGIVRSGFSNPSVDNFMEFVNRELRHMDLGRCSSVQPVGPGR